MTGNQTTQIGCEHEEFIELLLEYWAQGRIPCDMVDICFEDESIDIYYGYC